ncbi:MAG: sulfite exporter TauE/SafE family protein [Verrucomicrobia bacterium]|nr:sulfite exporter TauE/SafE family protein [Verrucomicrobiota bacterium]
MDVLMLGLALALAVLIGLSLGLLGSGGSIITLPVLVYVARIPAPQAVGMALVIVVNCFGGLTGQLRYVNFDWLLTLGFLLAALAGMFAGTELANRLSAAALRRGFAWCVVCLGFALIAGNGMLLVRPH